MWVHLNAVERQAAQWLGYDEKRWEVSLFCLIEAISASVYV
jgi:hypothetical protein